MGEVMVPLITFFLYVIGKHLVECEFLEGLLESEEDWAFLGKFCLSSGTNRLAFQVEYPKEGFAPQKLLIYNATQWDTVQRVNKNCTQRENVLRPEENKIIELTPAYFWSGCIFKTNSDGVPIYSCQASRTTLLSQAVPEYYTWYLAVSHCGTEQGLYLKYNISVVDSDGIFAACPIEEANGECRPYQDSYLFFPILYMSMWITLGLGN